MSSAGFFTLPLLQDNIHIALLSFLGFFCLQLTSLLFRKYFLPKLNLTKPSDWDAHVVSTIHAVYASYVGALFLLSDSIGSQLSQDKLFGYHPTAGKLAAVNLGYFLWDLTFCISHRLGLGFTLHSVSSLFAFIFAYRPFAFWFGGPFLLWELSTIPLNIHYFFDKTGLSGSRAQLINGACLILTFFGARIVCGTWVSYVFFVESARMNNVFPWTLRFVYLSALGSLNCLNMYWFYKIIRSVQSRKNPKNSAKKQS